MSTKKTIQINPELFKMSKTKKVREKKELTINPVVSPNNIKNKLLKRIKEHKTKELKASSGIGSNKVSDAKSETYTDEFYGAIDYLSELTKKQKQQKALNNKTLKTYSSTPKPPSNIMSPGISLELPPELAEPSKQHSEIFNVNYKPNDDVPYGCLKNGHKKTYREWKELTKAQEHPEIPNMIRPPTPPKKNVGLDILGSTTSASTATATATSTATSTVREQRLEQIKHKLRKMQDQETSNKMKNLEELNKLEESFVSKKPNASIEIDELPDLDEKTQSTPDVNELIKGREEKIEKEIPKKYFKKTVKRKFTLGKSDKLRRVSVLIKDRQTRKNIINTQQELKKTNITDVRKYLRQHGMIKVGSTCPADILRKTFEAAMLTGEVTNTNKETLLHNFLNSDTSN
jgi:hypothetical protein